MQTATEVRRAGPRVRIKNWTQRDALLLVGCAYAGIAFAWLLFRVTPLEGVFGFVVCAYLAFVAIYWFVVRDVEGPLLASDRVVSVIVASAAGFVLVPLVLIIGFVIVQGAKALTPGFFVHTLETVGPLDPATAGGGLHAIVGTFMQVGAAMIISVPLGLMVAIYLNEIGGRPARPVRFVVDAMSGVPSIVAGLFIYAVWIVQLGNDFSGLAAALALSVLMLPTVIRTSEEMLRIVPDGLREASLALGAPEWRTVSRVVLPTARAGLITAVILGVARAVGETAPLIMTAFGSSLLNGNLFAGAQSALPLFSYALIRSPQQSQIDRAWTGALVLIAIVLGLFTLARVLGNRAGKGRGRRLRKRGAKT
ncbi:MAG TPA: phosphate ABC transporter permease PstA [Actinomycetota bacterium]|jgi:phosphate transport system permease protein|nr:phosphate ABC transporter permease PstA [Actinomycetota bacterium]